LIWVKLAFGSATHGSVSLFT